MNAYHVKISGKSVPDDGFDRDLGQLAANKAWWEVELPKCPDCGGDIVWYEAGYVPATRKCCGSKVDAEGNYHSGCGSMFHVCTENGHVILRREKFY
jgi:hypothetical protein